MHDRLAYIFAGPSLFGTGIDADADGEVRWLPPARRGDIEALLTSRTAPGVIGLADGTFHAYPSVSHIELREAMEAGWSVYGLCSMGAIRASEMRHMGMRPWGQVARMFCEIADFADDEVALVHAAVAPYVPLSEPLVHIRRFLLDAFERGWLDRGRCDRILESLRQRWYGERTLASLGQALHAEMGVQQLPAEMARALAAFNAYRIKQADLLSFVVDKPWRSEVTA